MNINFSGPLNQTGYGQVSTNLFINLAKTNNVSLWPLPTPQHIEVHENYYEIIKNGINKQAEYDFNAPSFRHWHQFDLAQHVGKGPRIGSTVFELNKFTKREIHHLKSQDAICVPTKWAKSILENNGIEKHTLVLPHGVDREIFNENVIAAIPQLKDEGSTVFINVSKWEIRKGHDILIEAFNKAFESSDNVRLVMSCVNPFYSEEENKQWEHTYVSSKLGDKVVMISGRLESQYDVAALMACADCGVFPARAEGWGLESLELMSMGKQVILTDYAGHTEYANDDNSLLISPGSLEDAYDGKWFHGQGQWASLEDDQVEQIVLHMRSVHANKQSGTLGVNKGGLETAKKFSWSYAANQLTSFLEGEFPNAK